MVSTSTPPGNVINYPHIQERCPGSSPPLGQKSKRPRRRSVTHAPLSFPQRGVQAFPPTPLGRCRPLRLPSLGLYPLGATARRGAIRLAPGYHRRQAAVNRVCWPGRPSRWGHPPRRSRGCPRLDARYSHQDRLSSEGGGTETRNRGGATRARRPNGRTSGVACATPQRGRERRRCSGG